MPSLNLMIHDCFILFLKTAITLINQNPYGNGCALFTSSGSAARCFQSEVEVTQVGISKFQLANMIIPANNRIPNNAWSMRVRYTHSCTITNVLLHRRESQYSRRFELLW